VVFTKLGGPIAFHTFFFPRLGGVSRTFFPLSLCQGSRGAVVRGGNEGVILMGFSMFSGFFFPFIFVSFFVFYSVASRNSERLPDVRNPTSAHACPESILE
jgi:hypothetical protein